MPGSLRRLYTDPGEYVDCDHADVIAYAKSIVAEDAADHEKARLLFLAVRDDVHYQPYLDLQDPSNYRASGVLARRQGQCIGKAALYAAVCRAHGLPARVGFADVQNHLATKKLREAMGSTTFYWHGYAEVYVESEWRKATPTFNTTLCAKFGVAPLDFDGRNDALLHAFDGAGRQFMHYVTDHGAFNDVPTKFLMREMERNYPGLVSLNATSRDMEQEAAEEFAPEAIGHGQ
ncbi:MAG: transglutaminase-like domain-containing protein [Alphaproteobacteria bacterium]|nr:transglutaminase-like domain-containing protein [Alphaproteobacteria bacterium]